VNAANSDEEQTSESYLVLVTVVYTPSETVYNSAPLPPNAQRNFLAGAGEGSPFHALHLQLEGVISVEGTLVRSVTAEIPTWWFWGLILRFLQRVTKAGSCNILNKGPSNCPENAVASSRGCSRTTDGDYETWLLDELDLSWLVESDGMSFVHYRVSGFCEGIAFSVCDADHPLKGNEWRNMDYFGRSSLPRRFAG
jgi:hypothetical protein